MERPDPYRPPRSDLSQRPTAAASAAITRKMIDSLTRTRPWVLLIAIFTIVMCVFMVMAAIFMVVVGNFAGVGEEAFGPMAGWGIGAIYLVLGVVYLFPALYLLRYAAAIKRITPANPAAMEEALEKQASFWKFVGILVAVITAVYVVLIGIVAVVAIIGAAARV